jgi:uncharacterized protein YebE (UPF0316 family)
MVVSEISSFLGLPPGLFHWVLLPLLIFLARVCDVSINTVRVIFMLGGRRYLATALGFFESLIWLTAISQILQNVTNYVTYVAYAGGFATGVFVGMLIEDKLAIGNVIVRIITQRDAAELIPILRRENFRLTVLDAEGRDGPVNILFLILPRNDLQRLTSLVEKTNPNAIFTVESVKSVRQLSDALPEPKPDRFSFFRSIIRK